MAKIEIREINCDKLQYIDLLLMGDEQEDMIDRYLDRARLFIAFCGRCAVACCALTPETDGSVEVKNLAVSPAFRRQGLGRAMLRHAEALYSGATFRLGTGETPSTLLFYQRCGYAYHHRVKDFFTLNYDHPIVEEGVTLRDMVYLEKQAP